MISIQFGEGPEVQVFHADSVLPEMLSSTLSIAEQPVRRMIMLSHQGSARIREYLGATLLKEELIGGCCPALQ